MPKVSVIIPVYNVEKYLRECLDSVVNQTLKDIEIICVDDGSTDSSLEILKEYAQKDSRIRFLKQKHKGTGTARNFGLKHSKGEYLYFMDSDDYLDLCALEKIYQRITNTNAEICVFKNNFYHQPTENIEPCNWQNSALDILNKETFNKYDIPDNFFNFCNIPAWTKVYKSTFIKSNRIQFQNLKTCNDVYFNFMSLVKANSITFLNETLLTWRTEHSNTTATRGNYIHCILYAFNELKRHIDKPTFELLKDTFYNRAQGCFKYELNQIKEPAVKDYWTLKLYKFLPEKYWTKQVYSLKEIETKKQKEFIENIFSVKNVGVHMVICILGIKLKFKVQKLVEREQYKRLEQKIRTVEKELKSLKEIVDAKG